jgi:HlyD family secretion protein
MKLVSMFFVAVGLTAGAGSVWYSRRGGDSEAFRTAAVERGDLVATISATGTLEPQEVVDVGAQVAGQIKALGIDSRDGKTAIDYCSEVKEGTVLARLDDALFKARVDQARAQAVDAEAAVAQAEADLKQAQAQLVRLRARNCWGESDWGRAQRLRPTGAVSQADFDAVRASYETARADLAAGEATVAQARAAGARAVAAQLKARATLREAETQLGYTVIRSPVNGVIIDRRVNVGQTVIAGLNAPSLFLIAKDLGRLQLWASVNEADIGQIHPGQAARFTVDAHPGAVFRGEVAQIRLNASTTQNVVTYTVVVNADNSSGRLLPYLTANLQFEAGRRRNVLLVPNAALRWRPQPNQVAPPEREAFARSLRHKKPGARGDTADQCTLWVTEGEFLRPVKARTGLSDGSMTEVVGDDLRAGTQVVVGAARQGDGEGIVNPFLPQRARKSGAPD